MATSYRRYDPNQVMLLPAALQDWPPQGHLAYFISDTVDALDLSAFCARYAGGGARSQPFHPAMMVKVLVYGYATGVFSSRKIERRLHEDLAFRLLGAGNTPKHRTIRDFRALHLDELSDLFVQVVKLAQELGLVKLGTGGRVRRELQCRRQRPTAADPASAPGQPWPIAHASTGRRGLPQRAELGPGRWPADRAGGGARTRGQRQVQFDAEAHPHTANMAKRFQTEEGCAAYRRRKWIAEPPNGWIKHVLGFRQFSLRGLEKVQAEWKLVCMALNLRRMGTLVAT